MKRTSKTSPGKLKQAKITGFFTSSSGVDEKVIAKKRKNDDWGGSQSPSKAPRIGSQSPVLFKCEGRSKKSPTEVVSKENRFEDENRSFLLNTPPPTQGSLSPRKRSPRKSPLKVLEIIDRNKQLLTFDDFGFEDFENDPFGSPKKSPKKNVEDDRWLLETSELSFETPIKCRVLRSAIIAKGRCEQILQVKDEKLDKKGICKLRDVWTFSSFNTNDLVTIQTVESEDGWVVDNKIGYVVLYPDIVISSTSLVSSMFCMRQGLLSNFFKGVDAKGKDRMLIGSLVHELLQECLKCGSCTSADVSRIMGGFLSSHEYLRDFYFSGMTYPEIVKELHTFVPRVRNFLDVYVNRTTAPTAKNFKGVIENVLDIEEMVRSTNLGLQGRIDVTVRVNSKNTKKIAPLELKTGKASFSNEHRSQLILYVLLMNEIGRKVESGLLLYLRDDLMEEVIPKRDEIRNLFLLRNQLVGFYKSIYTNNLPDPIRNAKACEKCSYLRVCTSFLRYDKYDTLHELHPLRNIEMPDISDSHVEYFMKWNKMLWMEYAEMFDETSDDCEISDLKLHSIESVKNEFRHRFIKDGGIIAKTQPGTFVHVLNGKNNRECSGKIIKITETECLVMSDKKLDNFSDVYTILVYKSKFISVYMSNLGCLLDEQFESLRQIIIDKRLPTFQEKFDKQAFKEKCLPRLMALNKQQRHAVTKALFCNDYLLIKGPPGTGKTQTVIALIRILVALGQTVLIASHTHSSIDNILVRLDDVDYLRLGALKSISKKIHHKCYANLIKNCVDVHDVEKLFAKKVIASTCLGLDDDLVSKMKFDVCVIDESSQVLQPEILKPLFCSRKFVLVGDEDQLPPVVHSLEAKKLGMDVSMFEWLSNDTATVCLRYQYRMNSVINTLANAITYNGLIECANEEVAKATVGTSHQQQEAWVAEVLSNAIDKSVIFVDTSSCFLKNDNPPQPRSSLLEANIVVRLVGSLINSGLNEESIGVVAPFCDQIELLKKKLDEGKMSGVELNTVDQYQGRDKDVILFSCGKENQATKETSESELLNDQRRLTVAVTRAKHKLVIVGDRQTVIKYKPFQKLINALSVTQFVSLSDGQEGFCWKDYLV